MALPSTGRNGRYVLKKVIKRKLEPGRFTVSSSSFKPAEAEIKPTIKNATATLRGIKEDEKNSTSEMTNFFFLKMRNQE